jgi:outer membrane protein OmpA-like peptidoglycan-associated protein
VLTCNVDGGWGYVLGSSKDLRCRYHPNHGDDDRYVGSISKIGVDIGYTSSATIVWDVVAPTSDMRPGALQGDYGGATASATLAVGLGAHVLLGGFDKSIALQPVSVESSSGFDIAAGIGALSLRIAPPEPVATNTETVIRPANYALWFEFNDDRLTPSGRKVVADAVLDAQKSGARRIIVTGHADSAGTDTYNQDLSQRRADAVKREMVRDGLDEDRIEVAARGDHDPAVATPPGVRDPENRRVVITWDPDARMKQASR